MKSPINVAHPLGSTPNGCATDSQASVASQELPLTSADEQKRVRIKNRPQTVPKDRLPHKCAQCGAEFKTRNECWIHIEQEHVQPLRAKGTNSIALDVTRKELEFLIGVLDREVNAASLLEPSGRKAFDLAKRFRRVL